MIVDIGNVFPTYKDPLKAEYLMETMTQIGYDAINIGNQDFYFGQRFLLKLQRKYQLPLISGNIYYKDTKRLFAKPYIIREFDCNTFLGIPYRRLKIGIFGLTGVKPHLTAEEVERELDIESPVKAAQNIVNKLRKKCDIVILLAQLNIEECKELAQSVEEIDIIIGSGRKTSEVRIGETLIVPSGFQGKYIGNLEIYLDTAKEVTSTSWKLAALDKKVKEDSTIMRLIAEYANLKKLKKL